MMDLQGKRVLVVGLARSGRAVASFLRRRGATVSISDSSPAPRFSDILHDLMGQKIAFELGIHRERTFLQQDLIVVSPGVPWELPQLEAARKQDIPIIGEVELASGYLQGPLVGITGTNGKTTTTTLIGEMLECSGFSTFVGGNIGVPLISAVDQLPAGSILVAELSSFQLEGIQHLRPRVAVLLNITPNHLDRHPSFSAYVSAKAQIFRNQTAEDYAVLNADDENVMRFAPAIASRKVFFSRSQDLPGGIMVSGTDILYRVGNLERVAMSTHDVMLRGSFNLENVLAATAAAAVLGADFDILRQVVKRFRGVEHRLEHVGEIRGITFYNDSKATSVDATAKALTAFDHGVHLILGGKDKGAPYTPLRPLLEGRVRNLYLIGAAADRIAQDLKGVVPALRSGTLSTAVRQAFADASPGDVVLLSPACSSYDQFHDFEERGRAFKGLVAGLDRPGTLETTRQANREFLRAPESAPAAEASGNVTGSVPTAPDQENFEGLTAEVKDEPPRAPRTSKAATNRRKPKRLDLVSVYEVGAEEFGPAGESASELENLEAPAPTTFGPLETVSDEPLPYEVRGGFTPLAASKEAQA